MEIATKLNDLVTDLRDCRTAITYRGGEISATAGFEEVAEKIVNLPASSSIGTVIDNSESLLKLVPINSTKYAYIKSFGGMTYKVLKEDGNLLPYPYIGVQCDYFYNEYSAGVEYLASLFHDDQGAIDFYYPAGALTENGYFSGNNAPEKYAIEYVLIDSSNQITLPAGTYKWNLNGTRFKNYIPADLEYFVGTNQYFAAFEPNEYTNYNEFTIDEPAVMSSAYIPLEFNPEPDEESYLTFSPVLYNVDSGEVVFQPRIIELQDSRATEIISHGRNRAYKQYGIKSSGGSVKETTLQADTTGKHCYSLIQVEGNKGYVIQRQTNDSGAGFRYFLFDREPVLYETKAIAGNYLNMAYSHVFITPANAKYLYVRWTENDVTYPCGDVQISLGNSTIPYAPYREPISYPIPKEIQEIKGYGKGIDSSNYNYVDLESDTFNEKVELDENGELYVLSEPNVTPLPVTINPLIEVEGGGSIEIITDNGKAIPNTIIYQTTV